MHHGVISVFALLLQQECTMKLRLLTIDPEFVNTLGRKKLLQASLAVNTFNNAAI